MNRRRLALPLGCLLIIGLVAGSHTHAVSAADTIRSMAVVDLTFDEESGDGVNASADAGGKGAGKLQNDAARIASPFWNQDGKRALILDAAKKQYVELIDAPYVDRPDAVTVSLFFLSLHGLDDDSHHGIVAKRSPTDNRTNYGINYRPKANSLQVYINDGSGFRSAVFSAGDLIASRRLVHLTASFEVADAPAPDDDSAQDDLLIRLYVDGEQVAPTSVPEQSRILGRDAWIYDVDTAGLLNDVPVILGASASDREFTSGLIDEFLLFARALGPSEAAQLFTEVAGPDGSTLAAKEKFRQARPQPPRVAALSRWGLQLGQTNRLTIAGQRLDRQPKIVLPLKGVTQTIAEGSTPNKLVVDVQIPADATPGFYPVAVQTSSGLSNSLAVAVDHLPEHSAADTSPESPAQLPAAFSGTLSGTQQARVFFRGSKGQRIVADVEARRLGARMDPVLEVKNELGTPLSIEWGKVFLRDDTRAEIELPADGLYYVELHDLSYKAPGQNPFRLKVGDLMLVDALFPHAAQQGVQANFWPVGPGVTSGTRVAAKIPLEPAGRQVLLAGLEEIKQAGPTPPVAANDTVEILEIDQPAGQLQTVSTLFADKAKAAIGVNGRLSQPNEEDKYQFVVTPGQKLEFSVDGRAIHSPIDAAIRVLKHPEGTPLAASSDDGMSRDPQLQYTVPEGVQEIQLAVRDLHQRGGSHFLYRLQVAPADRPNFEMTLAAPSLDVPAGGTALARLDLKRSGYNERIALKVLGDDRITVSPTELPPGNATLFLTFRRDGGEAGGLGELQLMGESVGLEPPVRRLATVSQSGARIDVPGFGTWLPTAVVEPSPLDLKIAKKPPALFKGLATTIPLEIDRSDDGDPHAVLLTLMSNEAPRRVDPRDPNKGDKPLVRAVGGTSVSPDAKATQLRVDVPLDVEAGRIDFVLQAEAVPHAYSRLVQGTAYSEPFRLPVRNAAEVSLAEDSLSLAAGGETKVRGTVKRTEGFSGPVEVSLAGLPQGYKATNATVAADGDQFELTVTVPKETQPGDVPNVTLRITSGGAAILPDMPAKLKVAAPATEAKPEQG